MSLELAHVDGAVKRQRAERLSERLAERVGEARAARSRRRFEANAEEARGQAETIRPLRAGRMARTAEPPTIHVVAVVGSAGGIRAIQVVLGALPADLDACVLVVIHLTPLAPSLLPAILGRATELQVASGFAGAPLEPGIVWVAPPDAHLLVEPDETLRLDHSELVHHVRPSADVLLLSLASNHHGPCTAIVLSGTGIDGAAGAAAVKSAGGRVLAQDEATSQYFGMPGAAILAGGVDEVLPLDAIAPAVLQWAPTPDE